MKYLVLFTCLLLGFTKISAQEISKQQIPLILPPWYQYAPLSINTTDYNEELADLNTENVSELINELQIRKDSVSLESLFIFSVRLYDMGMKDEAVYWFHTAKIRATIFTKFLDPEYVGGIGSTTFELKQGFVGFVQLAGTYINGYAGGDVDKWVETLRKVQDEARNFAGFTQYAETTFLGPEKFAEIRDGRIEEYGLLISYLETNKKKIKKQRKENGIDNRF